MYFYRFYIEGPSDELERLLDELKNISKDREVFDFNDWGNRYSLDDASSSNVSYGKILNIEFKSEKKALYFEVMDNSEAKIAVKHILELNYQHLKFFYKVTWENNGYESNDSSHKYFDFYEYDFFNWENNSVHYTGHSEQECVEKFNQENGTKRRTIANMKGMHQEKRLTNIQVDSDIENEMILLKIPWWQKHKAEVKCKKNGSTLETVIKHLLRAFSEDKIVVKEEG